VWTWVWQKKGKKLESLEGGGLHSAKARVGPPSLPLCGPGTAAGHPGGGPSHCERGVALGHKNNVGVAVTTSKTDKRIKLENSKTRK